MKALPPGLYLVGLGLPEKAAATVEAVDVLRRCEIVFTSNPSDGFFRSLCRDARTFGPVGPGAAATKKEACAIVGHAKTRAVAFAIYGHPLIYEPIVAELLAAALRLKIATTVVAGVSALDAVLARLKSPLEPGAALQVGDVVFFLKRAPASDCSLFVYKAGMTPDRLPELLARLKEARGGSARVAVVEEGDFAAKGAGARWTTLEKLSEAGGLPYYASLFVPERRD